MLKGFLTETFTKAHDHVVDLQNILTQSCDALNGEAPVIGLDNAPSQGI